MSSESTVAIIFYSSLGIATLVTSVLLAFRFVKNCTSPLCSCNQDTAMSGNQQSGNSLASGLMNTLPSIMTTVTSNESTGQKIAEVVGDVASALNNSQPQQSNPLESGIISAIPNIVKTVTSGESVGKELAGVVGDVASSVADQVVADRASSSNHHSMSITIEPPSQTEGLTARVTTAVNNAMAVHTKAVTASLELESVTKKKYAVTPVAIMPDLTHSASASDEVTDVATAV